MWSWKQSHFETTAARKQMLDFCEREGISHVDQHIGFAGVPPEQFRTALAKLRDTYAGDQHIRCIMLHHYESLRPYLEKTAD